MAIKKAAAPAPKVTAKPAVKAKPAATPKPAAKATKPKVIKPVVKATKAIETPGPSTADIYRSVTGSEPGTPEKSLTPQQYREQILNQFEGSPQLGKIDVSKGYAGEMAQATLAHLLKIGPQGYVGVNSGKRDDREYASVLEGARRYAAEPTGVRTRNPNMTAAETAAGEAQDARVEGDANAYWTRLSNALAPTVVRKPVAKPKAKAKPEPASASTGGPTHPLPEPAPKPMTPIAFQPKPAPKKMRPAPTPAASAFRHANPNARFKRGPAKPKPASRRRRPPADALRHHQ